MQRNLERRIRRPCRFGDKIGGSLQAIQIDAKMQQLVSHAERKQRVGPCADRFTVKSESASALALTHMRTDPECYLSSVRPTAGATSPTLNGSAV